MKLPVVAYKPSSGDVTAQLCEHVELMQADGAGALTEALIKAEGVTGAGLKTTPQMLDHAPRLKAWSTISVGHDNFDVLDLTHRGIVLTHAPDVSTESTADTVFSLIFSSARRVVELAEWVRAGNWQRNIGPELYGMDVQDEMIGIVGLGRIDAALARRMVHGFRMRVLHTNRHPHPEAEAQYGVRRVTLGVLLAKAGFVYLQVPSTPEAQHLTGVAELAKMKRSAILISALHGAVIGGTVLIDALRSGTICGAGPGVFEHEPPSANSPLLATNNVVALPHISSATHETRHTMARCAVDNLIKALIGTLCENLINPQVLESARAS